MIILHADVTGYRVGDELFERGVTAQDSRGVTQPAQAYNVAARRAHETGLPIEVQGVEKIWDFKAKAYVLPETVVQSG